MKLRNKKTGEIIETIPDRFVINSGERIRQYDSLTKLNAEWEDYEEKSKDNDYWYIDDLGRIQFSSEVLDEVEEHPNNWMVRKSFGNYFSSREEAKKALDNLKAWKQLKDDGITYSLDEGNGIPYIVIHSKEERGTTQKVMRIVENLIMLFGGEDD